MPLGALGVCRPPLARSQTYRLVLGLVLAAAWIAAWLYLETATEHWPAHELFTAAAALVLVSALLLWRSTALTAALRERESLYESLVMAANDAIVRLDPQGRVVSWNPAAEKLFGYSTQEAVGADGHAMFAPESVRRDFQAGFARFRMFGQGAAVGRTIELAAQRKDGSEVPVELTVSPLRLRDGWHAVGIVRDVSERKRAQADLTETNRRLEEASAQAREMARQADLANRAKSEFLANVSHEIRTPLNGVIGMTGLLLDTNLTPEQRDYAGMLRRGGEALLTLVNDLLDTSKIESGRMILEKLEFDLETLLEESAETVAPKAREKGLLLAALADPAVPRKLLGDARRLLQVLVNLAGNAVKFTEQGEVVIRVSVAARRAGLSILRFAVTDTGIGIAAGDRSWLFAPFTQGDASFTRRYGGSGLGLAIARQLVELMGGEMGVESELGRGSEFWFTVVLEEARNAPAEALRPELSGLRVLVAHGHGASREHLANMLGAWDCRVETAADGEAAWSILRSAAEQGDPCLAALIDEQLAGAGEDSLPLRLRRTHWGRSTSLVAIANLGSASGRDRLASAGFAAALEQPVRGARLWRCLRSLREPAAAGDGISTPRAPRPGARVLAVEDDPTSRAVILAILSQLGCQPAAAGSGEEALEALQASRFDLVLMDGGLPGIDGCETARRIRAGGVPEFNTQVPIIAVTASVLQQDRDECLRAGMNDSLPKPLDMTALADALQRWLAPAAEAAATPAPEALRPAGGVAVLDQAALLRRFGGDRSAATVVAAGFLEDFPRHLAAWRELARAGDAPAIAGLAHRLKGAAAAVSGESLLEALNLAERSAAGGEAHRFDTLFRETERRFLLLKDELESWMGQKVQQT